MTRRILDSVVSTRLLIGKVIRVSTIGEDQMQCVQLRCRRNQFNAYLNMYFRQSDDLWAYDAKALAHLSDLVLIRRIDRPTSKLITHNVERVVFRHGYLIDPITNRRVVQDRFEDDAVKGAQVLNELVTEPMQQESLAFDERRQTQRRTLHRMKHELQRNSNVND